MTRTFEELKMHFERLADSQGCIFERNYHVACHAITDMKVLEAINSWLISSGIRLRRGVGEQYKQELLKRIRHPHVRDVKDTKDHTHKNTDKEQESKRIHLDEKCNASFHLNKIIEDLKCPKIKDEFLPGWKKRKAALEPEAAHPDNFQDMVTGLVNYVKGMTSVIPNPWGVIKHIQSITSPQELMTAYTKIYSGDYNLDAPDAPPPTGQFKEFINIPEEDDDGRGQGGLAGSASQDPVDDHLYLIAKNEYTSKIKKKVKFDNDTVYTVDVAETPAQKAAGLEIFDELPKGRGLLFPFDKPDHVTFHMGRVSFPIDILFFMQDDLGFKVAKLVDNAFPGIMDLWSNPQTACVLELPGGTCVQDGIELGSRCQITDRVEV
jgi:uncharacterized membrane protein (UPF0127 family)